MGLKTKFKEYFYKPKVFLTSDQVLYHASLVFLKTFKCPLSHAGLFLKAPPELLADMEPGQATNLQTLKVLSWPGLCKIFTSTFPVLSYESKPKT